MVVISIVAPICSAITGAVGALPQIEKYVLTTIKNQFSYLFCYDKLIQNLRDQVGRLVEQKTFLQRQVDAERQNLKDIDPAVLESLKRAEEIKKRSMNLVGAVPGDQHGAVPGDQQHGAVPGDQQHGAVPGDQHGAVAVPGDQHGAVPGDQHGAVPGDQQHGAVPGDQHGAVPGDQHGAVAVPGDQHGVVPGDQHGAVPGDQNGSCLNWNCPKPKLSYCQSRQATKLTAAAVELREKFEKFSKAYPAPREIKTIPPPSGTREFESQKQIEEGIMACLKNDTIFMIGVCGMGGVGKTTMAKKICRTASELFDEIVTAVVSQPVDLRQIQKEIAKALGLDLEQETLLMSAELLYTRLVRTKKVLIVLDDVWETLNLAEIGIPSPNVGCKIILTSRNRDVCTQMHATNILSLDCLSELEAWVLFREKAGTIVDEPDLVDIAKNVAKECKGLPLALVTVGSALTGEVAIYAWENALAQLKSCSVGFTEVEEKVFRILEWSFNRLKGCARDCFLYCCLYPEDEEIEREELIDLFILAELLIPRRKDRESEHVHGHTILNNLVKACLLEETQDSDGRECIKMHDLIRDMALRITGRDLTREIKGDVPRFLVSGIEPNVIVEESQWTEDLKAVSTFYRGSIEIPSDMSPKCKNLSTLLFRAAKIERIPDSFFRHMDGLKVLDLRECSSLKELPNSVSNLVNLTALLLGGCSELESVPPLGKLKQLRELDLSYTDMGDIPQGLELLFKLERLNMTWTRLKKKIIPKGTFSKLNRLQHLVLPNWVHVRDLQVLKQLQVFKGRLTLIDVYNEFITSGCWPKHYDITVVEEETPGSSNNDFRDRLLEYNNNNVIKRLDFGFGEWQSQKGLDVVLIPEDITHLTLSKCFRLSDGNLHNLIRRSKDLVHLEIWHSEEVEFVVNFSSPTPPLYDDNELVVLPNLRELWLSNLPNLVGLINWGRQQQLIPPGTFSSLTQLIIRKCHRLKKLFTVQLLSQQQNLESLEIMDCSQLEEMIAANDNDEGMGEEIVIHPSSSPSPSTVRLPKLQHLWLSNLPQLENKNCKAISIICDSIQMIEVFRCPKLKRMPVSVYIPMNNINTTNSGNGQTSSSSAPPPNTLEWIVGYKEWWESLEWDHYPPNSKDALLPFFKPFS